MNAHAKRWLTAIILLPFIIAVIGFAPSWIFALFITCIIAVGTWEYGALTLGRHYSWRMFLAICGAVLCPALFFFGDARSVIAGLALFLMVLFFLELMQAQKGEIDLNPLFKNAFGFFYLSLTLSHFIWLREGTDGIKWIFFVLVLAFSGDTAAYYVGRAFGRRPLIPKISAGKTVEGTVALVIFSALCCYIYGRIFFTSTPSYHFVALGFVGSTLGQLGDLCESALKRMAGVKDASNLLPGHGGLLDRLDCLIFVVPFVYHYKQAFIS